MLCHISFIISQGTVSGQYHVTSLILQETLMTHSLAGTHAIIYSTVHAHLILWLRSPLQSELPCFHCRIVTHRASEPSYLRWFTLADTPRAREHPFPHILVFNPSDLSQSGDKQRDSVCKTIQNIQHISLVFHLITYVKFSHKPQLSCLSSAACLLQLQL